MSDSCRKKLPPSKVGKFPLDKNQRPMLEILPFQKNPYRPLILKAKIDTGADSLMIPNEYQVYFKPQFTGKTHYFTNASGESFRGYEANILLKIKGYEAICARAYFFDGPRILFGLRELLRNYSFCVDRSHFILAKTHQLV